MTDRPAPMTPPGCDLRDFPKIMIDVPRLFASTFNATASRMPLAWMIGHKLWYRSWHQVPAGSLPADPDELCHLAELGFDRKSFDKARPLAMRGWVECSDGRLYHPVVCEAALEGWQEKLRQRLSSGGGNLKRWGVSFDPSPVAKDLRDLISCLERLNPQSKAILKAKKSLSGAIPPGQENDPTGTETASHRDDEKPGTSSQGIGTGTGTNLEKKEANASSSPAGPDDVRTAFEEWNALALRLGLPVAKSLTEPRRKKLKARIASTGLSSWREALAAVEVSKLCRGLKGGENPWRADIDFLLQPSSFQRLIEGSYGQDATPVGATKPSQPARVFPGPPDVRATLCSALGEDFVQTWLDQCGWQDVPERAITSARRVVLDRLRADAHLPLQSLEIGLVFREEAAA